MHVAVPNKRRAKQERTRELLLDAAARVFARKGYHGASLEEVSAEAGLSTGAVYSNFSGKEDLFLALTDREVAKRVDDVLAVMGGDPSPEGIQAAAAKRFAEFIREEPHWPLLFFEFFAYGARNEKLRGEFVRRRRAVRQVIAEGLEQRAAEAGIRLPLPAQQIAVAFGAVINGLAFERVIDPESVPDELFGLTISRLVIALLAAEPEEGP